MAEYLFVYGTLMKAAGHPMGGHLTRHARYAGPAAFQGKLYRVAHYPGVVASDNTADRVHGELYEVLDPAELFAVLDDYESCSPRHPKPTKYVRVECSVSAGAKPLKAWIYLYNWPVKDLTQIASGRFLAAE